MVLQLNTICVGVKKNTYLYVQKVSFIDIAVIESFHSQINKVALWKDDIKTYDCLKNIVKLFMFY